MEIRHFNGQRGVFSSSGSGQLNIPMQESEVGLLPDAILQKWNQNEWAALMWELKSLKEKNLGINFHDLGLIRQWFLRDNTRNTTTKN